MARRQKAGRSKARPNGPPGEPAQASLPPSRHPEVNSALAMAQNLRDSGDFDAALDLCRQLQTIEPGNGEIFYVTGSIFAATGDIEQAIACFEQVTRLAPRFADGHLNLGHGLAAAKRFTASLKSFKRALALDPSSLLAHQGLANVFMSLSRPGNAIAHLKALTRHTASPENYSALADALEHDGQSKQAIKVLRQAAQDTGHKAPFYVLIARIHLTAGDRTSAHQWLEKALTCDPFDGFSLLTKAQHFTGDDQLEEGLAMVRRAIARTAATRPPQNAAVPLNFALARLLERTGERHKAFNAWALANATLAPLVKPWAPLPAPAVIATGSNISTSEQPVFILGAPRSGTSLVEQIIASHSRAFGLGETDTVHALSPPKRPVSPEHLSELAGHYLASYPRQAAQALRVTDKSISNLWNLDLITALFPRARLIYCQRHPMDNAWSIFTEYFGGGAHPYAYDLNAIGEALISFDRQMQFWLKQLPETIHTVRYEDLVTEGDRNARALISHCGLEWQQACLEFHKSARVVRTASLEQVRQPLYTSSIGRWRPYASHLDRLQGQLKELIFTYEHAG